MTDNAGQVPAGWYPDPSGAPRQRYFDGEMWTEDYHGEAATTGGAPAAAKSPFDYYKEAFTKNYLNFSGRARRAEYWWFTLFNIIIGYGLMLVGGLIADGLVFVGLIYFLAAIIPSLALSIRRLHDTGKSGWFVLISLIPIIGSIILLVFLVTDGDRGPNQYGPSPKYA